MRLDTTQSPISGWLLHECRDGYAPEALELHVPQLFCPACHLWPAVRELASAGDQLFPGWTGKKVLAEVRGFADLK